MIWVGAGVISVTNSLIRKSFSVENLYIFTQQKLL